MERRHITFVLIPFLLFAFLGDTSNGAIVPRQSSVHTTSYARGIDGTSGTTFDSDTKDGSVQTLSASSSSRGLPNGNNSVSAEATATWDSAASGRFDFDLSYSCVGDPGPYPRHTSVDSGFEYLFNSTTGPGLIHVVYAWEGDFSGNDLGLNNTLAIGATGPGAFYAAGPSGELVGTYQADMTNRGSLRIGSPGYSIAGGMPQASGHMKGVVLFAFDDPLPGATSDNPLLPDNGNGDFSVPVISGGYGTDDWVFIDPDYAIGYDYASDIPFTSVLVPDALPGGDAEFEVLFGGTSHSLVAGTAFDFTQFVAGGVNEFTIAGIDPGEMIDPDDPLGFVTALKYAEAGLSQTTMVAVTSDSVPEPAAFTVWSVLGVMGLVAGRRRRTRPAC